MRVCPGSFGIVEILVTGAGVYHQTSAQIEAFCHTPLRTKVIGERVVIVLLQMLVEGLQIGKLNIKGIYMYPSR